MTAAKKLVIGASGFVGSHVTRQLVDRGDDVRVLIRRTHGGLLALAAAGKMPVYIKDVATEVVGIEDAATALLLAAEKGRNGASATSFPSDT